MKRIYIAGPISKGDLAANINQATEAFIALVRAGLAAYCPHWSCYSGNATKGFRPEVGDPFVYAIAAHLPNELTHQQWLAIGLAWVAACDGLLRLPGESVGADAEVAEARLRGKPVFHSVSDEIAHYTREDKPA